MKRATNPYFTEEQNAWLARMNFDEASVPPYELPAPLALLDGTPITTPQEWFQRRRPELLSLFARNVYGEMLPPLPSQAEITEETNDLFDGLATRRQITLSFPAIDATRGTKSPRLHLILHLPNGASQPAPCFVGLGFHGNQCSYDDARIPTNRGWFHNIHPGVVDNRATEASRGQSTSRWPLETILKRGYALASLYYGDIEPDHPGGFSHSIRAHFQKSNEARLPHEAGAITAWAWGLSRIADYLLTEPRIDPRRLCVTGHSRLGKTALWAAANDERFALVVSNNSGCGGASLSNRNFGETLHILSNVHPQWFAPRCRTITEAMASLPIDQHLLIALQAPRPVFISSASIDPGADPLGEYLAAVAAREVYQFLGFADPGPCTPELPPVNTPSHGRIGHELREGNHNITPQDWLTHLDFADRHLPKP